MAMFTMYGNEDTHYIQKDEPDHGCYFEIYGFEGDNDDYFVETWLTNNGHKCRVEFHDPAHAMNARKAAEDKYDFELKELVRLRVPEYFYKEFYL